MSERIMGEEIKKDSVYNVMRLIYKVLKKQELVNELFLQRAIHFDASTKAKAEQLSEEDKLVWYMVMLMHVSTVLLIIQK